MDTSTHIEDYLERLIQFKQAKELHTEYIEESDRRDLLRELMISLGFEETLWQHRENEAAYNFFIYDQIKDDNNLNIESSDTYKSLCEHFLLKAINLDPFNAQYLAEYVKNPWMKWKPENFRKIQYLQLFRPTSTESTSLQVDLSIRPEEMHHDYFTDEVIHPFVDAMVFLKDQVAHEQHYTSEEKLKHLASEAGIDAKTMGEIKQEIEQMYELISDANNDHWLNWNKVHKAYLTADKMVDLSPYQPKILEAAIRFYGNTLWRAILGAGRLNRTSAGYKEFCLSFYGKKKPRIKDRVAAAQKSIDKANALRNRYMSLPKNAFSNQSHEDRFIKGLNLHSMMGIFKRFKTPMQVNAFVHAQNILHQAYHEIFMFKERNFRFGFIVGVSLYLAVAIVCQIVFGSWLWILTFIMVPGLLAVGIAAIQRIIWKTRSIDIDLE